MYSLRGAKAFVSSCQMPSNASQSRCLLPKKLVCFRSQDGTEYGADYIDPQLLILFANQCTCQTLRRIHRGARNWPEEKEAHTHNSHYPPIHFHWPLFSTLKVRFPSYFREGSRCDCEGVSHDIETCYLEKPPSMIKSSLAYTTNDIQKNYTNIHGVASIHF